MSKRLWVGVQAFGAPFGLGFWTSLVYFFKLKPKLRAAGIYSDVAVTGDGVED